MITIPLQIGEHSYSLAEAPSGGYLLTPQPPTDPESIARLRRAYGLPAEPDEYGIGETWAQMIARLERAVASALVAARQRRKDSRSQIPDPLPQE